MVSSTQSKVFAIVYGASVVVRTLSEIELQRRTCVSGYWLKHIINVIIASIIGVMGFIATNSLASTG